MSLKDRTAIVGVGCSHFMENWTASAEDMMYKQGQMVNQEDAPVCDQCGAITVRNGSCYRCFVCGSSMGCS